MLRGYKRVARRLFSKTPIKVLGGVFQGALDQREAALGLLAQEFFLFGAIFADGVEFVGNSESGEDGDFLRVDGGGDVGDGAHFFVDVGGEFLDVALVELAANGVDLAEDLDFYGIAHLVEQR
jgi:hypothetical protein